MVAIRYLKATQSINRQETNEPYIPKHKRKPIILKTTFTVATKFSTENKNLVAL